jgi:hypothetical protein
MVGQPKTSGIEEPQQTCQFPPTEQEKKSEQEKKIQQND